ncbi:sulfatase family protein [Poritiphilus flavus]|uniref:Sulfatase-like hydrolase/transferase n=1 Tax=Poritiphilus flavus TaxID=2697053 RepID=A0A6L9ECF3_9FLAO|nr:sulfatase [Poritiphilus flavus]NAS12420.1 sulfatase-like hydrolase/transferase [Poritiphilus flavus]
MNTRRLFGLLSLSVLILSCKQEAQTEKKPDTPPNIVFIMSDDHAVQAISAYGHPISHLAPTPNIDRIAKNGVLFQNSFCTNSICGPSRAVILTGKHSHINGFRMNGERFDGSQPTLPKYLRQKGYKTAIVGKWHLHGAPTGFDYWDIIEGQGHYYNPKFIKEGDSSIINGYATDIITDKGLSWLKTQADSGQPFFLMLHHKAPHRNWMPALRHANQYDSINFPLPDTYFAEHQGQQAAREQQQTIYEDMYAGYDLKLTEKLGSPEIGYNPWPSNFERMTEAQRQEWDKAYQAKNDAYHKAKLKGEDLDRWLGQRYLQDYLASISAVDEGVGQILDYLETAGLDQNTLVVYTSDQGFYLGEKGWFDKRFMYEESLKMPLLMQLPGVIQPGSQITALVQNLDFAQTFLDFAGGQELTSEMQGQSFRKLLEGTETADDFRELVYYHYYDYPAFHMVKKHYGIRTKRYKLMHFYDDIDSWEFYDLEKDPQELYNAIEDEQYKEVVLNMRSRLDSVQEHYKVTPKEFEQAPRELVNKAFKDFERLKGPGLK